MSIILKKEDVNDNLEKVLYDYVCTLNSLLSFLEDNNFDIKLIGFVFEIRDKWEEAFDISCFKDCCEGYKELYDNLSIKKLMEETRDIYKEVGRIAFNKIRNKEIIRDKVKFEFEYLSVMNSINKYFDNI